jgi:hypothetical protein
MSFLKKLGGWVKMGVTAYLGFQQTAQLLLPKHAALLGKVGSELAEAMDVIVTVEALGQLKNLPGAEKAELAGPLVGNILLKSSILIDKKIADPAAFHAACIKIAGGLADVLNAVRDDDADKMKID